MNLNDPKKLEEFVQRAVAAIPERRAPRSLEARVLAEIDRRAALPWWRRSYGFWPAPMRGVFLVLSAAAAAVLIAGFMTFFQGSGTAEAANEVARRFAWLSLAGETVETLLAAARNAVGSLPSLWVYGALAAVGACYATLACVGAAAYKTFFVRR
jgi:hypothetical protein